MSLRALVIKPRRILGSSFLIGITATVLTAFICYFGYAIFYPEWLKSTLGITMPVIIPALIAPPVAGLVFYHVELASTERAKREHALALLRQEVERRRRAEEKLSRQAKVDPLTGAASRAHLRDRTQQAAARARRHNRPLTLAMVGIDEFHLLNQRLGHEGGDQILQFVASVCQSGLRDVDVVGRYSDDRFVLLLEDTTLNQGRLVAERLKRAAQQQPLATAGGEITVTTSYGLMQMDPKSHTVDDGFAWAEHALIHAQSTGHAQVCVVHDEEGHEEAAEAHREPAGIRQEPVTVEG